MADALHLNIGLGDHDNTRALVDGTVTIAGVDATVEGAPVISEIFERMVTHRAFDVSELGLTFYLRTLDLADPPFIAIPIFPARHFRHSNVFVNTSSGIDTPQDLVGKTIGEFGMYGTDVGVWVRGILSDEYGVKPDQSRWIVGGTNRPIAPFDFIAQPHPDDVVVTPTPEGKALGPMLEAGEIDALISVDVPESVLKNSPQVAPLFPDPESVERDYFRRTGIFPIMHTVVVRRDLLKGHPGLADALYRGFCDAKDVATQHYRDGMTKQHMSIMIPWFTSLFDRNRQLLGADWWPCGVDANRAAIDTFLRYHFEQGLSGRRLICEDIFIPELMES
ncbi:4,5-dihydroxyphthalate decarboxylase [Mycobacterium koreense]|uniref:4,5-dihydroxyphthalate decarboxylase n=1 Tax=Mycolicibacillus koreensis TaxID=1069220 RepID=A0A7I7SI10_9MYCO|nr:4,5-dihydroxyphthalate decarboxylase [Mycolicibacillus koreensis]MCV7247403.1 4,5-dihydroxyphthalate decarboxylase [Mycolicibacillus koreensis]OSC34471.1 4,5-dihydroxyphthalate decarboxylase [Mycolicibacillus koreensis]BBY56597.1 4,5-dihydroxyphthalate decarboxylase [Mycolicibacillus koreensis]